VSATDGEQVTPVLTEAMAAARRGDWDGALELVERAIAEAPDAPEPLLAKARLLRASGRDRAAALRALRRAVACAAEPLRRADVLREYGLMLEPIGRHREAASAFEEAIGLVQESHRQNGNSTGPRLEELLDQAARAHERAGDPERALGRHRQALPLYRDVRGDMAGYHAREAELLERLGLYAELCTCYGRLVEIDPDRVLFAQPAGRPSTETTKRLKNLLQGINEVLGRSPGALVPRVLKAGLFYRLGRYRNAASLLRRTIETGPEHWFAWHLRGKVQLKMGKRSAARASFQRARTLGPTYLDLLRDTALVRELCGELEDADDVYREIEASWPGDEAMLRRAARVRERLGRLEEAYESYRLLAVQVLPPEPALLERLADLARRLGRPGVSEEHLAELLELLGPEPTEERLRVFLRRAEVRADAVGAHEAALRDVRVVLDGARRLAPGPCRQLRLEAATRLLESFDRPEDALELVDAILEDAPDDVDALLLRGDALFKAKRFEDSVSCYTSAADRRLADALLEEGRRLFDEERFDKALGKWTEAFSKDPRAWEIHYCAAAAYARLGQPDPAARYIEAAAKQNPGALALMQQDRNFDLVRDAEVFAQLGGQR
jgi:tetratricopeptide (TPR) repeat protein